MADPFISIIVPTRNRSALLSRLLTSLGALRYPRWEAIVVDDGSVDDTAAVVERFRARGLPLRYLWQTWRKMGAARNRALAEARGEIVAFTDDDCVVDPDWLHAIAAAFAAHPAALGVQGKTVTDHAAMTPFTRQVEQLVGGQPYRTCNIAYRTAVVRELGGFDPHLIRGEDVVMGQRVLERGPIVFAPAAVVRHPPPAEGMGGSPRLANLAGERGALQAYLSRLHAGPFAHPLPPETGACAFPLGAAADPSVLALALRLFPAPSADLSAASAAHRR